MRGRFFEFNLGRPAMPSDVAEAIESAITSDNPPFRVPVGKDANEITAGRTKVGDEEWVAALCIEEDDAFLGSVFPNGSLDGGLYEFQHHGQDFLIVLYFVQFENDKAFIFYFIGLVFAYFKQEAV